ncbi:MAG: fluoride efflux transporter CrcB [Deferrisomatales bacterium]|nr:fluoride efflux transporter CrcB [Deferrisomatales bacterium]
MSHLVSVACGAVLGASGRYLLTGWVSRALPGVFPWGTLAVNWLGCLVIGLAWGASQRALWSPQLRTFLFIGILGSFTTFSSFGLETLQLLRGGEGGRALLYVLGSNLGGFVLVWLGLTLVRA